MSKITWHAPGGGDPSTLREPREAEFNTLEELLALPDVQWWNRSYPYQKDSNSPRITLQFHRFSISRETLLMRNGEKFNAHLMAEFDNGKHWFCIGYIKDDEVPEGLPAFCPVREE